MTHATKYNQLQQLLKEELSSGRFRPGDRFYTEREIMEKYQVSSITVARAIGEMTDQGYFERKRKLGTFVLESPEMPGMTGKLMTRPLYLNTVGGENSGLNRSGVSWFLVEEIRRGIINSYPGAVKIVDPEEIMAAAEDDPELPAIMMPQHIENYALRCRPRMGSNTIEIVLPPTIGSAVNTVRPNYLTGVFEAMEHLIRQGHRRIAFLGRMELRNRYAAYRIALETYEMPFDPGLVFSDPDLMDMESGAAMMRKILALRERPTAVFCCTDKIALGAMRTARELGVSIPGELSIVGFDDIAESARAEIPLTTVKVPYYEIGECAVKMLLESLKLRQPVHSRSILTKLEIRSSTGPVPAGKISGGTIKQKEVS